ncbi:MAG TPA: M23 family metallopeptidase [Kofleriaceae bacterium]|nr:M23 family metallopeptidase [Kofleriaceae bacterium]
MCPRCGGKVTLLEGRPFVTAFNVVELWHSGCFDDRDVLVTRSTPLDFLPTPPTPRLVRALGGVVVGSMLVAIVISQWTWGEMAPPPATSLANIDLVSPPEPVATRAIDTAHEGLPARIVTVETQLEARYDVPMRNGARLDEMFPSLRMWTHPVTGSAELMPEQASRHFGARREGIDRPECGEGHCGVDLDGPRGRPLVAVAGGTVVRVERSELGLDGRSGRYVRIEHDDGTLTAYMHMDDVADVQVGDRVVAGQYVGTLGATAVFASPPHLHFSLEVPDHPGVHGDNTDTHYVDPAPFLVRATMAATAIHPAAAGLERERQHTIKPAF